jgi:hypothetical protein
MEDAERGSAGFYGLTISPFSICTITRGEQDDERLLEESRRSIRWQSIDAHDNRCRMIMAYNKLKLRKTSELCQ